MLDSPAFIAHSSTAIALCGVYLAASLAANSVLSVQQSSARSALAVLAVALTTAMVWVLAQGMPANGMHVALASVVAVVAISSVLDQLRPSATVLFSALIVTCLLHFKPLLATIMPTVSGTADFYVFALIACIAQLVLLAQLPLSPQRFTKTGYRRMPEAPSLLKEGGQTALLSSALALVMIESSEGKIEALAFTFILAGLVSALVASAVAYARKQPFAVHAGLVAFPAGICAMALLSHATLMQLFACAALTGACTVWAREALLSLRIDDASDLLARLGAPLLVGWFAPAALNLALLAPHIQALGAMLVTGLMVGIAARGVCQFLTGLNISSRTQAEGLDTKFAATGATR